MPSDKKLEGILMPMPVAFKNDGAIDPAGTDAIIDFYLASGVHGFFRLGTHGQGMVMEIDERKKVAEQIVNRVRGRVPVVMHIGTANTLFVHRPGQACRGSWGGRHRRCPALLLSPR